MHIGNLQTNLLYHKRYVKTAFCMSHSNGFLVPELNRSNDLFMEDINFMQMWAVGKLLTQSGTMTAVVVSYVGAWSLTREKQ